jgi:hypothetical protein
MMKTLRAMFVLGILAAAIITLAAIIGRLH